MDEWFGIVLELFAALAFSLNALLDPHWYWFAAVVLALAAALAMLILEHETNVRGEA